MANSRLVRAAKNLREAAKLAEEAVSLIQQEEKASVPGSSTFPDLDTESSSDWEAAIDQCNRIVDACDDVPDWADEFASDVQISVEDMMETINRTERVTERQQEALDNWEDAIERCRQGD